MESEIAKMNRALDMLKFKCWYYEQAIQDGGEDRRWSAGFLTICQKKSRAPTKTRTLDKAVR